MSEWLAGATNTHQPPIFTAGNRHYWQRLNLFPYPPLPFARPAITNWVSINWHRASLTPVVLVIMRGVTHLSAGKK
ncbi:hypothetical protein N0L55_004268 [Escherichia coli]|nr:hypothetical protein [Escherichia coli]EIT7762146.1 hypothetical protein [Escherichia coli]EJL4119886.1 hypothetical protein [Escherichia coli]EJQ6585000.1 hypothetical protein [Escherichia coli]HCQ2397109.1 hypothetical protein [Escherichia coli]